MATASSGESQAPQTKVHAQALDEVFAEMSASEPPPKPVAKPARVGSQVRPLREYSETPVEYTPIRATRVALLEEPTSDWTGRMLRAVCVGCILLIAFFFYRGMSDSWRDAIIPPSGAPIALASAAPASHSLGEKQLRTKPIEDVCLGDRLAGHNPIREQAELIEPDPATWRQVSLYMTKENALGLWIELLRPLAWIENHDAKPGRTIFIDLYEMGAVGDAQVQGVGPCPEIQPGDGGAVVIGTFKHQADENSNVVHLKLEDQIELTGVTGNHPYWSVDRQAFVEVGNLRIGELVDTMYGRKHVVSITPIEHTDFLYNFETTEHVYRVGSLGTLVHNTCVVPNKLTGAECDAYREAARDLWQARNLG